MADSSNCDTSPLGAAGRVFRTLSSDQSDGRDRIGFLEQVGQQYSEREAIVRVQEIFNGIRRQGLALLDETPPATPPEDRSLAWFATARSLVDG